MRTRDSFQVGAPLDLVFAFLADPRYLVGLDSALPISVVQLAGDGPASGARFRVSGPALRGAWLTEFTEFDPPHRVRMEFREETGSAEGWTSYKLEARQHCTQVRMEGHARVGFFVELGAVLMSPIVRWAVKRENRKLAGKIEAWARSTDVPAR